MAASHIVVTSGPNSAPPRRSISLKLRGGETGESIMMFEETIPTGTKTSFHLHHDSDEVAYVLSDEITVGGPGTCTFMPRSVPHAWMSTGAETGRVLFLYTPAKAGELIEEQQQTGRKFADMSEEELTGILNRHGWEIVGPSPF
jgi:quercetin dioxygenase-like cupin family protein